eukprot:1132785-Pleurochrysis_carterae.AAC.1
MGRYGRCPRMYAPRGATQIPGKKGSCRREGKSRFAAIGPNTRCWLPVTAGYVSWLLLGIVAPTLQGDSSSESARSLRRRGGVESALSRSRFSRPFPRSFLPGYLEAGRPPCRKRQSAP